MGSWEMSHIVQTCRTQKQQLRLAEDTADGGGSKEGETKKIMDRVHERGQDGSRCNH